MNETDLPPATATGFWSIERFVAFVLGPALTAASGWLSTFMAKKFGIHLGGAEIAGVFATGGLAAGGLSYKWLHGRQIESSLQPMIGAAENFPMVGSLVHTTVHDLEGLAQKAASDAVAGLTGGAAPTSAAVGAASEA